MQNTMMKSPYPNIGGPNIHPPAPGQGRLVNMEPVDVTRTTMPMQPNVQTQQQPMQQTGLSGFESALQGGLQGGTQALQSGAQQSLGTLLAGQQAVQNQLGNAVNLLGGNFTAASANVDPNTGQPLFQQAAQGVGAFSPAGLQAQQRQAALSGTLGQEAFDQALINNPAMNFLREQGEQSIINQAAATGGLGGGNVQRELARFGQGLASQDLQNQIANQQALSEQGLRAAGQQGQFLSQAGQQQGNLASLNAQLANQTNLANAANRLSAAGQAAGLLGQGAGITANMFGQGAGIQQQASRDLSNLLSGTAQQVGQGRLQTGRDIASQLDRTTGALSDLANQQGLGLSGLIGDRANILSNLLSGAGQDQSQQLQNLQTLLANLSVGSGTNQAASGQSAAQIAQQGAATQGAQQAQTGGAILGALASFFSDERLKDNIEPIGTFNGHNVYSWTWNDKMPDKSLIGEKGIGVIAQEVYSYAPELIIDNDKSGYLKVNYGGL